MDHILGNYRHPIIDTIVPDFDHYFAGVFLKTENHRMFHYLNRTRKKSTFPANRRDVTSDF